MARTHTKLVVSEAEIPTSFLTPYRTIEEKLNSCSTPDEISILENQLLMAIDQQQESKLTAIQEEAIAEIKAEIEKESERELGLNVNYEEMIKGMVNPDQIEAKKSLILNLLAEQKRQKPEERDNRDNPDFSTD